MVCASSWARAAPKRRSAAARRYAAYSARRPSRSMAGNHLTAGRSPAFQLYVLVWPREPVAAEQAEPGFLHPRTHTVQKGEVPDRREHRAFVDQLLDPVKRRLPLRAILLDRLLSEEAVD